MAYELKDLVINRVDLVDEGANSAAFIELYKRKENSEPMDFNEILSKMKPEHADVINAELTAKDADLTKAREDLATATQSLSDKDTALAAANEELAKAKAKISELESAGKNDGATEEELLKSAPEGVREMFATLRAQKEAAEEQVRKSAAKAIEDEAIAKAASLKAIPVEQEKLVGILKGCSPEMLEILTAANNAIEAAVLGEVGKNRGNGAAEVSTGSASEAWNEIEKRAVEVAKRDNITKEKAVSVVISEAPELYKQYIDGGAN